MPAKGSSPLKQGILGFAAGKRTAATTSNDKASRATAKRAPSSSVEQVTPDIIEIDSSDHGVVVNDIDNDSDLDVPPKAQRNGKRKSAAESISEGEGEGEEGHALKRRKLRGAHAGTNGVFGSRDGTENILKSNAGAPVKAKGRGGKASASLDGSGRVGQVFVNGKGELDDLPRDGRWTQHYGAVREKMGNLEPGESGSFPGSIFRCIYAPVLQV